MEGKITNLGIRFPPYCLTMVEISPERQMHMIVEKSSESNFIVVFEMMICQQNGYMSVITLFVL